jgi:hypothetical protein
MYQLHREKGVEKATGKIRESLGADWKSLSDAEIRMLERLLGEAWVHVAPELWEKIPFGNMTRGDVDRVLDIGKFLDLDTAPRTQVIDELRRVLLAGIS